MRKGFKKALEKFDIYQLDKYKMTRKSISLIDLFNLLHPKASGKKAEAYADIIKNRGKNLHTMYESRILEKEMTAAGQKQGDAPYALTLQKAKKLLSGMFSFFNKRYLHQFQNVKAHRLYIW